MLLLRRFKAYVDLGPKIRNIYARNISTTNAKCNMISRFKRMGKSQPTYFFKDNMPSEYVLIYRAPMELYLHWSNNISTLTATIISGLALYSWATDNFDSLGTLNTMHLVSKKEDIRYFAAGFIALNLVTRWFVAKYALRIYRHGDKYVAVHASQIPFRASYNQFQRGKVAQAGFRFNPWSEAMYRLGNRTTLLLLDYFKTPADFHRMCRQPSAL